MSPTLEEWFRITTNASAGVITAVVEHLPPGGTFVDIGAGVGAVTSAATEQRGAKVYAFEPVAEQAAFAQRKNPDARVHDYALGDRWDLVELWCDRASNPGWNTFVTEKLTAPMDAVKVKMLPLDSFDEIEPHVLKIDVEGFEDAVIRGGHRMIAAHKPVIVVELGWGIHHPHREEQLAELEWLFSIGYERVDVDFDETTDVVLCPSR